MFWPNFWPFCFPPPEPLAQASMEAPGTVFQFASSGRVYEK